MYSDNDIDLNFAQQIEAELWAKAEEIIRVKNTKKLFDINWDLVKLEESIREDIRWEYLKLSLVP